MANLLSWLNDNVRDVFDANTQRDQQKRMAAGQQRFYQDQQRQAPNVLNQANNFAAKAYQNPMLRYNPMTNPGIALTLANDVLKNPKGFVEGGKDVAKGLIANPVRLGKIINYTVTQKQMSDMLDRGEIDYNTYNKMVSDSAAEAGIGINDDALTVGRKVGGAVGGTALDVLTAGTMSPKYAVGLKTGQLGKAAAYSAPLINKMAAGSAIGASMGAANTLQRDELTKEQAAYDIGGGAILGGVVPAGIHGIGKAWQKLFPKQAANAVDSVKVPDSGNTTFRGQLIDKAVEDFDNGKIDQKQLTNYITDYYTGRFSKLPSPEDVIALSAGRLGSSKTVAQQAMDAALSKQRLATPPKVQVVNGKKVFAPTYNPTDMPGNAGKFADNVNPRDAGRFTSNPTDGYQRVISQRELDIYNKTGKLPANPEGMTNVIKPGELKNIKGIGENKKFLVTFRDGVKLFDEDGPQASVRGKIDRKFVKQIEPYVPRGDKPVMSSDNMGPVKNTFDGPLPKKQADDTTLFRSGDIDTKSKRGIFLSNERSNAENYQSTGAGGKTTHEYTLSKDAKMYEAENTTRLLKELRPDVDKNDIIDRYIRQQSRNGGKLIDGLTAEQRADIRVEAIIKQELSKQGYDGVSYTGGKFDDAAGEYQLFNDKHLKRVSKLTESDVQRDLEYHFDMLPEKLGREYSPTDMSAIQKNLMDGKPPYDGLTGLDLDGPSMYGKGSIGNDVPKSYLEPPKAKPPITEQGKANIVVGPPKGVRNLDIIKEDIGSAKANFFNRFDSIEKLVKKVELERGTKLKPSENPAYLVKQFLGGGGIANAKIDMELTPIIKQTKNFDGLREYLVATRMNELAQRGLSKRGDDMLTDLTKRVGADEVAKFDKISKELYKYQQKNLDELLEVGVLTPEQHANIIAKNQNYIPFNRVLPDVVQGTTQAGQKIRVGQSPIKAIKGSDKDIIDPIESMIRNTYDIQAVVQKQKVLRSLTALAPEEFVPLKSTASRNTPSIEMFVDGKRQKFETNKAISDALNSMNEERLNAVVRMMSLPAKMLRSGATSLNVAFALPNIVRDQLSAAVNSKYGGVPMYDFVSGLASVIRKDDSYKKWILSGADQASFFAQDRTTLSRGVQDITGGYKYKVGKLVKNPLELFRIAGEYSEKGSRVGVFKRAMKGAAKEGLTGEDVTLAAMRESREATIDFAQRGSKMKAYNALVPFLNARVQGTGKLMQSFKQRPVQTMAIGASIASVPAGVLYAYNTGDPEREKIYNEIPDYIKREYFVMVTGDKETPFVKIPKGEVGKIFGNPVESFLASARADDPEWKSTAISIIDSFLPVGSVEDPQRFITDASPTAVAVPYQMMSNFDAFRKSPIISQFQKDLPPEQQYSNYNTETGKKIGDALNISPAMLEFGISGFTGGLGRQGLQMLDLAQGVDIPRNEMPVMSRFLGKEKDLRDSANEVYEQADKDRIAKARENFNLKKRFKEGDESALEGLDTTKQNEIRRDAAEDQIKETLNPKEKALWSLPNADLEDRASYDKDAQTVLDLKDSLKSETSKSSKKKSYQKIRVGKPPKVKISRARKGRKAKVVKPNAKIESSIRRIASNGSRVKTGRLSTTVRRPKFAVKSLPKIKAPRNYA